MKRRCSLWIIALVLWVGCADGGPVGTGITSSSISGTVTEVDTASGAAAAVAPVEVSIDEAPGVADTTDPDGNFELMGEFSGPITLRFTAAQAMATASLDIPLGSETDLGFVRLGMRTVTFNTPRLRNFVGQVVMIDCSQGSAELLVNDRKAAANQFMIRVSAETIQVRGDGQTVLCSQIKPSDRIAIEGVLRADRTIEAITIIVTPRPPGQSQPIEQRSFHGTVTPVINCETGNILIDDDAIGQSRLRLSDATIIVTGTRMPAHCEDILAGDQVDGKGLVEVGKPDVVRVDTLVVRRSVASER